MGRLSRWCGETVWRVWGRFWEVFHEDVGRMWADCWEVWRGCLYGVGRLSEECMEADWRVLAGCLEGVERLSGGC